MATIDHVPCRRLAKMLYSDVRCKPRVEYRVSFIWSRSVCMEISYNGGQCSG